MPDRCVSSASVVEEPLTLSTWIDGTAFDLTVLTGTQGGSLRVVFEVDRHGLGCECCSPVDFNDQFYLSVSNVEELRDFFTRAIPVMKRSEAEAEALRAAEERHKPTIPSGPWARTQPDARPRMLHPEQLRKLGLPPY